MILTKARLELMTMVLELLVFLSLQDYLVLTKNRAVKGKSFIIFFQNIHFRNLMKSKKILF